MPTSFSHHPSGEQELDLTAEDGSPLPARVRWPRHQPPLRSALIIPGLALPGKPPAEGFVAALAAELAVRGVATLRCQGRWTLPGGTPLERLDWHEEIRDWVAALGCLRRQEWVAADQLYLVGLSLGGVAAPVVAARVGGVAGIFSWGATARRWPAYADATLRQQLSWRGEPADRIAQLARLRHFWFRSLADTSLSGPELLAAEPAVAELGIDAGGYLGRPVAFWRQLCRFDPSAAYAGLSCRICAVRGEADFVCHLEDQQAIIRAARAAGLPVAAVTLARADHLLRRAESAAQCCRNGGGQGPPDLARLARVIVTWMDGLAPDQLAF